MGAASDGQANALDRAYEAEAAARKAEAEAAATRAKIGQLEQVRLRAAAAFTSVVLSVRSIAGQPRSTKSAPNSQPYLNVGLGQVQVWAS